MTVLVTGGLGYIGSHTCVALMEAGHRVVILDNLCNTSAAVAGGIQEITGTEPATYTGDVADRDMLRKIFSEQEISAVVHFAALKSAPGSVEEPLRYYRNNLAGSLTLIEEMDRAGVRRMVFSSSACVYGISGSEPIPEDAPLTPENPYGWTKAMTEQILRDLCRADGRWSAVLLRYFNPVGAHKSGLIGEVPGDRPGNLMPRIVRVAAGLDEKITVTGTDYPTPDGTGVRDYIHVVDLAEGHTAALDYACAHTGAEVFNLGRGRGVSVLELIDGFERATGVPVPRVNMPRRPGDLAMYFADPAKAKRVLGWEARRGVEEMCADSWRFAERWLSK